VRSKSGEDRGGVGQRAARAAALGSRDHAEVVGWFGRRAEGRTRQRLSGGGCGDSGSGELVAWL
jgi:hypothetical protein